MDQYSPPTSFFKGPTDTDTPNQSEDVQTSKQAEILQEPRLSGFRKKSEVNQDISQLKAIAVYGIPGKHFNSAVIVFLQPLPYFQRISTIRLSSKGVLKSMDQLCVSSLTQAKELQPYTSTTT